MRLIIKRSLPLIPFFMLMLSLLAAGFLLFGLSWGTEERRFNGLPQYNGKVQCNILRKEQDCRD